MVYSTAVTQCGYSLGIIASLTNEQAVQLQDWMQGKGISEAWVSLCFVLGLDPDKPLTTELGHCGTYKTNAVLCIMSGKSSSLLFLNYQATI